MRKTMLMKKNAHVASLLDSSGHVQEAKSINLILSKFAEDESVSRERDEPRNFPPPHFMKNVKDGFVNFNLLEELYDYIYKIVGNEHRDNEKYLYHLKNLAINFARIVRNLELFNESKSAEDRFNLVKETHWFFRKLVERLEMFEENFNVNFTERQQDEIQNVLMFILDDLKKLIENDRNIHESKKMNLTLLKFAEDEVSEYGESEPPAFIGDKKLNFVNFDVIENIRDFIREKLSNNQNNEQLYQDSFKDILQMFKTAKKMLHMFNRLQSNTDRNDHIKATSEVFDHILESLGIFENYFKVQFSDEERAVIFDGFLYILEDLVRLSDN